MRMLIQQLLILICVFALTSAQYHHRRRKRCFVRLCFKCDLYVNSKWKRSIPDGEFGDRTQTSVKSPVSIQEDLEYHRRRWTERDSNQMKIMLEDEGVFYTDNEDEEQPIDAVLLDVTKGERKSDETNSGIEESLPAERHLRKRSINGHISRCLHMLRSRCCRLVGNSATYIGYRVKKH